jgi:hypothetical protein
VAESKFFLRIRLEEVGGTQNSQLHSLPPRAGRAPVIIPKCLGRPMNILKPPRCSPLTVLRMVSSGMLGRVALVRIDISEELSVSFISVKIIGELGTTLAVTRISHCLDIWLTDGGEVGSIKHRPHSTSQKHIFISVTRTHIC